jgi:hypothetical protein
MCCGFMRNPAVNRPRRSRSHWLIEPFAFVRYDIAGPKPFQTFLPSSATAWFGRAASRSARKVALSEYLGFKSGRGASGAGLGAGVGAGVGAEVMRASPDGGLDVAAASEEPAAAGAFGS